MHLDSKELIDQASSKVLAAILQQVPVGVVVADAPSGRILLCNGEAERIWGRSIEPGESIWAYRPGLVAQANGEPYGPGELPLARALRTGEVITGEHVQIQRPDGGVRHLSVSAGPVRDAQGRLTVGVAAYVDVTTRVLAETRVQSIIDSVDGIVWELDASTFRFTLVSQQATRLLGYPLEDWYEPNFWVDILHPADREWAVSFCLDRTKRGEAHEFEYRVKARDGRIVWLRDIVTVISEQGVPKVLRGLMVDITAARQLEEERQQLLALERSARESAERHAREAQDALRLRDEFLSVASHELRTPLHSLQLLVQSIVRGDPATFKTDRHLFGLLDRQVRRLSRLVSTLLDVSSLRLGRMTLVLEDLDLGALVRDIAEQFTEDAARAGSPISIEGPPSVRGRWSRTRLEQVLVNLLSNAIKFGAGAPIDVTLEEAFGRARLVVRDRGSGIEPARLPRIFECFERGVSARSYGGLGLGLFLVRSIVEAHGGVVKVESTPGAGAQFTVELPLQPETSDQEGP